MACLAILLPLAGCGGGSDNGGGTNPPPGGALQGTVMAGTQPVSGAAVQFYAAGSTGYGSPATALLSMPATTDSSGAFSIAAYTCPAASAQVYLVALGGNPGLSAGTNNTAIALMTALGSCGDLGSSATASLNELTTAASVWALSQFMSAGANVGASSTNAVGLANAFAMVNSLVNVSTGAMPGPALPANGTAPADELNTLADILNACAGSSGASACASLFAAATPSGGSPPANTIDAALNMARNPALNAGTLFGLASATPPFQPALTSAPNDWTLAITYTGGGLNGPSALAIDQDSNVWTADYYGAVTEFSAQGEALSPAAGFTGGGLHESYGLTIDSGGNVWVVDEQSAGNVNGGKGAVTQLDQSGRILSGANGFTSGGINFPIGIAAAAAGNIWIGNYGNSTATVLASNGTAVSGSGGYGGGKLSFPVAVAVDAGGTAWLANQSGSTVTSISSDGTQVNQITCCTGASGVAVDQHGNVWVANYFGDSISELSGAGAVLSSGFTGGGLLRPQGIAVDGNGNIWVANYHGSSLTELQGADGSSPGAALSPATGLGVEANLSLPFALAVDSSGNLWVSNFAGNTVTQYLGAAAPVKTPLLGQPQKP